MIVRSASYEAGKTLADQVRKAMTITRRTNYADDQGRLLMRIISMSPTTLPIVYPRTPGNLTEWSINFDASYFMPGSSEGA